MKLSTSGSSVTWHYLSVCSQTAIAASGPSFVQPAETCSYLQTSVAEHRQPNWHQFKCRRSDNGYGGSYRTPAATRIATLPIGYADGLPRAAAGRFSVALPGGCAPLAGRVSMDLCSVDAGAQSPVAPGDEVLVFGSRRGVALPVEELAVAAGTISYEILTGIGSRVLRVAVRRGGAGASGSG